MTLVEIVTVNQGETHRQHPPGRLREPDPARRYFTSIEGLFEIAMNGRRWRFRRWSTYFGPEPTVALRRAYVGVSRFVHE